MVRQNRQAKKLLEQRRALASGLPSFTEIIRGSLITRFRRCGKPNCHCATTQGHGPAHYLGVTLRGGKREQILLSEEMVPVARRFLQNYQRSWAALEAVAAVNRRLLRLRSAELVDQGKSTPKRN